jgi:hypothetical protein
MVAEAQKEYQKLLTQENLALIQYFFKFSHLTTTYQHFQYFSQIQPSLTINEQIPISKALVA